MALVVFQCNVNGRAPHCNRYNIFSIISKQGFVVE